MRRFIAIAIGCGLLVAGEHAHTQAAAPPTLHAAMKDVIAPQAQILWDVSNNALDDDGNPDAKRVTAAQWKQIGVAGLRMKEMALTLAAAQPIKVAAPGVTLQDEGPPGAGAAQVQKFIDADPAAFSAHARELAAAADGFVAASSARDVAKLAEFGGTLDQVCETCHMQFWYPQQGGGQ